MVTCLTVSLVPILVSNTLSFLYTAAISRGIANNVIRNLRSLSRRDRTMRIHRSFPPRSFWNGQLPETSERYQPMVILPRVKRLDAKRLEWAKTEFQAWGPLGEVIRMAEGRDGLLLGRVRRRVRPEFFRLRFPTSGDSAAEPKALMSSDMVSKGPGHLPLSGDADSGRQLPVSPGHSSSG